MKTDGNWVAILAAVVITAAVIGATVVRVQHPLNLYNNYRLTVEVEVDGRPHVASQTYAYNCSRTIPAPNASVVVAAPCDLYGKALDVDLGQRGHLFVLLTGWDAKRSAPTGADAMTHRLLFAARQGRAVPPAVMPAMVRFQDPGDPESVQIVDPAHLDRRFGPGVQLISMTIDNGISKDTGNVDRTLPWLAGLKGGRLSSRPGTLAHDLYGFDFEWPPVQ